MIWNKQIVERAIIDAFIKLDPRKMMKNPVMFVVEVGSVLTTLQLIRGLHAFEQTRLEFMQPAVSPLVRN